MRDEPQAADYTPDPRILTLAPWLADPVAAADFPQHRLRWRNDRHAATVGLESLSDEDWVRHFGAFQPLPSNLPQPLALRYHGHQFRVYNPEIGDGRGFLFAQMRDARGRLLDLGTKGSGQTPWSRQGDGRLTLKGAVREVLATEMLEALGVNTSKTFSVIETGEKLWRGDEPSPTRSAVLVRLSHGHIRIGTFQRLAALDLVAEMEALIAYCLETFPGNEPPADAPGHDEPAARLLHRVVERLADMAASYMVAGFVHGVLNTDNMNVTGESFDYGPWRWLPRWDASFTAAYFDHAGLYAFGRQPEAILWNCGQLAIALRSVSETAPLIAALDRFGPLYEDAMARRFCWRLGIAPLSVEEARRRIGEAERQMVAESVSPDHWFFRENARRINNPDGFWSPPAPPDNHIETVERLWQAIDEDDDWQPLYDHVAAIRAMGTALGEPPPSPK